MTGRHANTLPVQWTWPIDGPRYRMAMGLRPPDGKDWPFVDGLFLEQMAERRRLLATCPDAVLGLTEPGWPAARELANLLIARLSAANPDALRQEGALLTDRRTGDTLDPASLHPLELVGRLAAEDHCILLRGPEGWLLAGAVVCFPNRWRLADKLGRDMPGVHAPVPGFPAALATPVERFFDALQPGRSAWRANWSINDDPALFLPGAAGGQATDPTLDAGNAGVRLFLRVERQTVERMPESGAILFAIRTEQRPLADLTPTEAGMLAGVLRTAPEPLIRYKGLHRVLDAALAALDRQAAGT